MSIALAVKVDDLAKRVETLERMLALSKADPNRRRNNVARQAESCRLRIAIERVLEEHPGYSAKRVLDALAAVDLGRDALPSLRTVQWHLGHLKASRNTTALHLTPFPG